MQTSVNPEKSSAFTQDVLALRRKAESALSKKDYQHLKKIIWINRIFLILGLGTAWLAPNPFSMICLSLALYGQWTMVAHHVCHGGYDHVPGVPARYKSSQFALGWRRYFDWLDWMYPTAWKYEHNTLHHFYTNEKLDPDLVHERIQQYLKPEWPMWRKSLVLFFNICLWKATYYSMNTFKALHEKKNYDGTKSPSAYFKQAAFYNFLPYISIYFLLMPLLFLPLGLQAVLFVFINRLGAEFLTNIHTFLTIVPNHAGKDIPVHDSHFASKEVFFVNQVRSSCNYSTGGFWKDYLQGYLNYQIEHHLFPQLPMSQYVQLQPQVKALCEKHGIPYKQESIFIRIKKTMNVLLMTENPELIVNRP